MALIHLLIKSTESIYILTIRRSGLSSYYRVVIQFWKTAMILRRRILHFRSAFYL